MIQQVVVRPNLEEPSESCSCVTRCFNRLAIYNNLLNRQHKQVAKLGSKLSLILNKPSKCQRCLKISPLCRNFAKSCHTESQVRNQVKCQRVAFTEYLQNPQKLREAASVTRLFDLLDFVQVFKAFGNNEFAQISHILR